MNFPQFKYLSIFVYSIFVFLIFFYLIYFVGVSNITNINFIKEKFILFESFHRENQFTFLFISFVLCIVYVFFLGLYFPVVVFFGFFFGSIIGTFFVNFACSLGSLFLYIFVTKYFDNFSFFKRFENSWLNKFKQNEFMFIFFFRIFGGGGIPSNLQNIIPAIFKINNSNYFFGTFFGQLPGMFVICNLSYQLRKSVETYNNLSIFSLDNQKFLIAIFIYIILFVLLFLLKLKLKRL